MGPGFARPPALVWVRPNPPTKPRRSVELTMATDPAPFRQRPGGPRQQRPLRRRLQPGDRRGRGAGAVRRAGRGRRGRRRRARPPFPAWAATPPLRRARVMFRFKQLLEANRDELAAMITAEHGKVLQRRPGRGAPAASRSSSSPAASRSCSRASSPSRSAPASTAGRCASRSASCAGITPFNFPAMVPMWMFPVAHRLRQHLRAEAVARRDPSPLAAAWPSC